MAHKIRLWLHLLIVVLGQFVQLNEERADQFFRGWLVVALLGCHFVPQLHFKRLCEQLLDLVSVRHI